MYFVFKKKWNAIALVPKEEPTVYVLDMLNWAGLLEKDLCIVFFCLFVYFIGASVPDQTFLSSVIFGVENFLLCETALCIIGCSALCLTFTH